jgi:ankyrin repeat protein
MQQRSWGSVSLIAALGAAALIGSASARAQPTPDLGIIEAVKTGNIDVARRLLADGADVDAQQGDGATALHWAAHRNDLETANMLIDAGATVGASNELGATPLWLAAINGDAVMVGRLLDAGAEADAALQMGETPLMTAARGGDLDTVELLLEHGADVNAAEHERRQTALMWAVAQRHPAVVRLLIAHGADVHARTATWDQLENTAGNTNPTGNFRMEHGGSTPLLFAARQGDVETARALIEAGANVNDTAAAGTSVLVIAAHSGHGPLATYLLEQGADPNAAGAGYTALHAAVLRSEVDLVDALLGHDADPNALLAHGTPGRRFSADFSLRHQMIGANAFWLAAKYGELEILRTLAGRGADPLVTPDNGMSALQAAMGITSGTENRRNRVGILPPADTDAEGLTLELAHITLDLGVDVNAADRRGDTALHYAVRQGFETVIELLAARGADLNAKNGRDQTPLSLADSAQPIPGSYESGTRPTIAALLRRLGATD